MKNKKDRYDTSGLPGAQFESGSDDLVLKNLLAIKSKDEMDKIEAVALKEAEEQLFRTFTKEHRFTAKDICNIHKVWLGRIYPWVGEYRRVNLSKGEFHFSGAEHVPSLMGEFEGAALKNWTPCLFKDETDVVKALAEVHAELVLIHPFREGNGRVARVLATLMALQAGLPLLNFSEIHGHKRDFYFKAVQQGMKRNYEPMEEVFRIVLKTTFANLKG